MPLLYVFRSNGKYIKFLVGAALSLSLLLTIKKDILIFFYIIITIAAIANEQKAEITIPFKKPIK